MTTQPLIDSAPKRLKPIPSLGLCALNWVIPGLGFLLAGDMVRGVSLLVLINGVFAAGLLFGGYIYVPPMMMGQEGFNIVALLTFLVQVCHGGGTGLILLAQQVGEPLENLLVRNAGAPFSDLGALHFTVAAALNYFATTRLWDYLTGRVELEVLDQEKEAESAESTDEEALAES